jgi:hypothetical protein
LTRLRPYLLAVLLLVSACAGSGNTQLLRPPDSFFRTMPNPDGCYMQVWETAEYAGMTDYINGPRDYASLRRMPNNRSWQNRIASVRVGSTATITAFADEDFRGATLQIHADTTHRQLPSGIAGQIESVRVACKGK